MIRITIAPIVTIERLILLLAAEDRGSARGYLAPGDREVDPEGEGGAEGEHDGADVEPDDDVVEGDGERSASWRQHYPRPGVGTDRPTEQRRPVAIDPSLSDLESGGAERRVTTLSTSVASSPEQTRLRGVRLGAAPRPRAAGARSGWRRPPARSGAARSRRLTPLEPELDPVGGRVLAPPPRSPPPRCRTRSPGAQPSFAAAIASTPEPVPRSTSGPAASPAVGELEQQLEAEPSSSRGRRCRTPVPGRPGCPPRPPNPASSLPGGPDDDPPAGDRDRPVEVAPAVGPVVGDLGRADLDQAVTRRRLEVRQARDLARGAVDRVLDPVAAASPPRPRRAPARAARRAPARRARGGSGPRAGSPAGGAVERLVQLPGELALLARELARDDEVEDARARCRACRPAQRRQAEPLERARCRRAGRRRGP